ncbi:MAG: AAA family ATPase [Bullifex sp.]|nr:AAA family ATPase [Bullifex sp.]
MYCHGLCHRSSESADVNMEAVFIQSGIMYRVTVCLAPDGMTGDLELIGERGTETVASYDRKLKILSGGFAPKEGLGPEHVKNLTDFFRLISVFDSIENMVEEAYVFSKDKGLAMLEEQGELDQGAWFIDNDNGHIQSMLFTKLLMAFGTGIEAVGFKLCEGEYQNVAVPEILEYKDFEIPIKEESSGTRRLIRIAFILSHVLLYGGQVVMIDELDAGLHDVMLTEIVKNFLKYNNMLSPEKRSQFIFSTHNTCLMGSKLLRKDQIWFTEMKEHHHTELYSLSDLKDSPRPTADFAMQYLEGRYGALPEVPEWKEEAEEEGEDEPL